MRITLLDLSLIIVVSGNLPKHKGESTNAFAAIEDDNAGKGARRTTPPPRVNPVSQVSQEKKERSEKVSRAITMGGVVPGIWDGNTAIRKTQENHIKNSEPMTMRKSEVKSAQAFNSIRVQLFGGSDASGQEPASDEWQTPTGKQSTKKLTNCIKCGKPLGADDLAANKGLCSNCQKQRDLEKIRAEQSEILGTSTGRLSLGMLPPGRREPRLTEVRDRMLPAWSAQLQSYIGVCALVSVLLGLIGLQKLCSFQKPVQGLHEPLMPLSD